MRVNLFDPEMLANPYPAFNALREDGSGVARDVILPGIWTITRFIDVSAAYRDERFSSQTFWEVPGRQLDRSNAIDMAFANLVSRSMLFADPPQHPRLRSLVRKVFTPRVVEQMRPRIHSVAAMLLDKPDSAAEIDFMHEIATPLPVMVISDMLGFPASDAQQIHRWAVASAAMFEPTLGELEQQRARSDVLEFFGYITDLVKERRARRRDDVVSALIDIQDAGDTLDPDELLSMIHLLFTAGNHTTTSLLGNTVSLLLDRPDIWHSLVSAPQRVPAAIEETLRLEPSFVAGLRMTSADVQVGDETIPAGDVVFLLNASANRDPRIIDRPDEMLLDRTESPHITFGAGAHFCLGAALARLEAEIVLKLLLQRAPEMRPGDTPPERLPYVLNRQYNSLPVRL